MPIIHELPSEAKCRTIVRRAIFGKRLYCPRCLSNHVYKSEQRYWCPGCRKKFSLMSPTWLKGCKLSFRQLMTLLMCWQKKVAFWTTCDIAGVSPPTARRYLRAFRHHLVYESPTLQGEVEMDEAWLGKRRHGNQTIVMGITERGSGKTVIRKVRSRDQGWSDRMLLAYVRRDIPSIVYHDGWEGYQGIDTFFGFRHSTHIHDKGDFGPTNHIENIWSRLKRFITRTWDHTWKRHLPTLLREFEARINSPELFENPSNYLQICLTPVPTAY
jgi:transposase-like protein